MQKRIILLLQFATLFCCFFNGAYSQTKMCTLGTGGQISNSNSSTINMTGLIAAPVTGNYSVTLSYQDPNTNLTVGPATSTCAVTTSGSTCVINWTGPALPTGAGSDLEASFDVSLQISSSTTYTSSWNFGTCNTALPLILTSFTAGASAYTGYNLLTWVTAQEQNTSHFLVQRSTDGASWYSHGLEPAAGNSSVSRTYNFYTPKANTGSKYYYRLQMIDIDNNFTYSPVKLVNGTGTGNPTSFCNYTTIEGPATICNSQAVFKVHNADAYMNWATTAGSLAISNGGAVATMTTCPSGAGTITAAFTGCSKTKGFSTCNAGTVSGPDAFCTSGSYSLVNAPMGAGITWSLSSTGVASLSCSACAAPTVNRITDGQVTITASVLNGCTGAPVTASKLITIGSSNNLTGTFNTSTGTKPLYTFNFIQPGYVNVQFNWPSVTSITSTPAPGAPSGIGFYSYGTNFSFTLAANQSVNVNINGTGTCGPVSASRAFYASTSYSMTASPNPASSSINLSISRVADTTAKLQSVQPLSAATAAATGVSKGTKLYLYNFYTNTVVKQWSYPEVESNSYNLNIAGVKAGVYVLKMERNNKTTTTKIIVQ